jgi:hypothetical protein
MAECALRVVDWVPGGRGGTGIDGNSLPGVAKLISGFALQACVSCHEKPLPNIFYSLMIRAATVFMSAYRLNFLNPFFNQP